MSGFVCECVCSHKLDRVVEGAMLNGELDRHKYLYQTYFSPHSHNTIVA